MQTLTIDNRDTESISIDTYQTFTGESFIESEIEHHIETTRNEALDYDSFDWEYDHRAIVHAFAECACEYLNAELPNDIIKSIKIESSQSPTYYNYTTDSFVFSVEYDETKLSEYIDAHRNAIEKIISNYGDDNDALEHASLCHYIDAHIDADELMLALAEQESEIYWEHTKITPTKD